VVLTEGSGQYWWSGTDRGQWAVLVEWY